MFCWHSERVERSERSAIVAYVRECFMPFLCIIATHSHDHPKTESQRNVCENILSVHKAKRNKNHFELFFSGRKSNWTKVYSPSIFGSERTAKVLGKHNSHSLLNRRFGYDTYYERSLVTARGRALIALPQKRVGDFLAGDTKRRRYPEPKIGLRDNLSSLLLENTHNVLQVLPWRLPRPWHRVVGGFGTNFNLLDFLEAFPLRLTFEGEWQKSLVVIIREFVLWCHGRSEETLRCRCSIIAWHRRVKNKLWVFSPANRSRPEG